MNIIEQIKALPRDLPLNHAIKHVERITVDELIALVESHERLLKAAKRYVIVGDYMPIEDVIERCQELERAIAHCENPTDVYPPRAAIEEAEKL